MSKDIIYRQDAIDAECGVCQVVTKREKLNGCPYLFWGCAEVECLRKLPSAEPEPKWIPCSIVNQCFVPELKDYPYCGMLFTYVTSKGKVCVRETWVERGRIVGKKMNGTPIAYMPLPKPYTRGEQKEKPL